MSRPRRGDIVEVDWLDAERITLGWTTTTRYLDAAAEPSTYRTAGYWMGKRNDHVLIALSMSPTNRVICDMMTIPVPMVRTIRVLQRSRKRTRKALEP